MSQARAGGGSDGEYILVAAAGQRKHDRLVLCAARCHAHDVCESMCRFECRKDSLESRQRRERVQGLPVGCRKVFYATMVLEPRVLGTDTGVIKPGGNGMRFQHLPILCLQQITAGAV